VPSTALALSAIFALAAVVDFGITAGRSKLTALNVFAIHCKQSARSPRGFVVKGLVSC